MEEKCENCRFWQRINASNLYPGDQQLVMNDEEDDKCDIGECRRFPPRIDGVRRDRLAEDTKKKTGYANDTNEHYHQVSASINPLTWYFDWCGEWQQKPDTDLTLPHS